MQPCLGLRLRCLVLSLALVGGTELAAAASDPIPLLFATPTAGDTVAAAPRLRSTAGPEVMRWRHVTGRIEVLEDPDGSIRIIPGQRIRLNLFDDANFTLTITDVTRHAVDGGRTWSGTLDGVDQGYAVVAVRDGAIVGTVLMPGAVYRIGYAPDGTQVVEQLDTSRLPREAEPVVPPQSLVPDSRAPETATDSASQIDVMVLYTAAARAAAGGTSAIQAEVAAAVAVANQAYANNGLAARLRLVFTAESSIAESGDFNTDLQNLRGNSDVASLRDTHAADLVSLITSNAPPALVCGIGFLMTTNATSFASLAFSVVERVCASSNLSFPHELGHNMGAHHDPFVATSEQTLFAYSHGYVDTVGRFRTIMAYNDQCEMSGFNCPRIAFFSTPNRTFSGRVIGTASTSDNERTLIQTTDTVANFRQSLTKPAAKVGVFRQAAWFLDLNGNGSWDGCSTDSCFNFGTAGDVPVVGNWTGTGLSAKVGVFRGGAWFLDLNGNDQWDGCGVDACISFGLAGDVPVVGDWTGSGQTKIGVFRNGVWYLDLNGNRQFDGCTVDACVSFGLAGDVPVVGDWTGSGQAKIGVFRNGVWYLDLNGNRQFDGCTIDTCVSFGLAGDVAVVGDWTGSGQAKIGVFRNAVWFLDRNGNRQWDGCSTDGCGGFGLSTDRPAVGSW